MQLRYVNPDALVHDIQIPALQVEPLVYGQVYDMADNLGMLLAVMPFWEAEQQTPIIDTPTGNSDLRRVKGIGAKTEMALANKGINSLHLLVGTAAEDIDMLLDGSLDYVTVDTILAWQEHARQLMEES